MDVDSYYAGQLRRHLRELDRADDEARAIEEAKAELRAEWAADPAAAAEAANEYVWDSIPERALELVLRGQDAEACRLIRDAIRDELEARIEGLALARVEAKREEAEQAAAEYAAECREEEADRRAALHEHY